MRGEGVLCDSTHDLATDAFNVCGHPLDKDIKRRNGFLGYHNQPRPIPISIPIPISTVPGAFAS